MNGQRSLEAEQGSNLQALRDFARKRSLYPVQIQALAREVAEREQNETGLKQIAREIESEKSRKIRTALRLLLELREIKSLLLKIMIRTGGHF